MRYYPVFLDIREKPCVVVGGGEVAERKALSLLDAGARVNMISPDFTPALYLLAEKNKITLERRDYKRGDLKGALLAFSATDRREINMEVHAEAKEEGVLLNVVDVPHMCGFIVPSLIKRGPLSIAISTSGKSPAMARKIRKDLEGVFGEEYAVFLELMGRIRTKLLELNRESAANKRTFEMLIDSPLLGWIREGNMEDVDDFLLKNLGAGYTTADLGMNIDSQGPA